MKPFITCQLHRIAPVLVALFCLAALARPAEAEYRFESGIMLSEEYSDNIYLTPDNALSDYVTRVMPSIRWVYTAPVWEWDLAYAFDYRYYAYRSREHDSTHAVTLLNRNNLIRDRLFLDVRDLYRRVSLDPVRDYTEQSLFVNQTDTNELTVSPFFVFNLTSHTSGTIGYQYRNLWYREADGINKSSHGGFVDLADELSPRTTITAGVKYLQEDSDVFEYEKVDVYAGPRYEYSEGSVIWLILGNSWIQPEDGTIQPEDGTWETQGFWDFGIRHQFLTYTLTVNADLIYIDDPRRLVRRQDRYTATFQKNTERWTLAATVGRWEFRDLLTKRLQSTRNGVNGTLGYTFTEALRGAYSFSINRYENNTLRTYSMFYRNGLRFEYQFPANTTLALDYRFEHGYSPDPVHYDVNYDNNRVALEIRKLF